MSAGSEENPSPNPVLDLNEIREILHKIFLKYSHNSKQLKLIQFKRFLQDAGIYEAIAAQKKTKVSQTVIHNHNGLLVEDVQIIFHKAKDVA